MGVICAVVTVAYVIINVRGTTASSAWAMTFNCPHLPTLKRNTDALARSKALTEGRHRVRRLVAFLVAMMPGFEQAFLIREANALGVRESC